MVLFTGGPYIPGLPPKAKPAKPKVTPKRVNTTTLAGVLAASKPKPPSTPRVFIPELATPEQRATLSPSVAAQAPALQRPTRTTSTTGTGGSSATDTGGSSTTDTGGSSTTGSIETGIVEKTTGGAKDDKKSLRDQLGITEELDIQQYQDAYDSAKALRDFQERVANRQLSEALAQIDRAAIEGYKDIANDYAARGMARSGGKAAMEDRASALKNEAVGQANTTLTELLEQLDITDTADMKTLNTAKQKIMADYVLRRIQSGLGG